MIDTMVLHMSLMHHEAKELRGKFPYNNYRRKMEKSFFNDNVKLTLFLIDDYPYLRLTVRSVNDLLGQSKTSNNDYDAFVLIINSILAPYNLNLLTFVLREIHYKLDISCTDKEKHEYLNAIMKCKSSYYNVHRKPYHNESTGKLETIKFKPVARVRTDDEVNILKPKVVNPQIKTRSKDVNHEITIYDKDAELLVHPDKARPHLVDILRIEIKIKKKMLDSYLKKHGIEKSLHNYFDSNMREDFFNELFFERFIGKGDYYSIPIAKSILKGDKLEAKCIKLFRDIAKTNYDVAVSNSKLSTPTVLKYIKAAIQKEINYVPIIGFNRLPGIPSILSQDTFILSATPLA